MESEVARIRQRIAQECEALRMAMEGFSAGASHQTIMARYESIGKYQIELEKLVGPRAEEIVCEMYNRVLG
ncbi:MAG TPA: hypothetical protein VFN35_15460 [Ktedonobacteraceae bacterium]|nr:hypothetical protein [Ktedonobacteraceae bacterium]